jgi:hypothetical protein
MEEKHEHEHKPEKMHEHEHEHDIKHEHEHAHEDKTHAHEHEHEGFARAPIFLLEQRSKTATLVLGCCRLCVFLSFPGSIHPRMNESYAALALKSGKAETDAILCAS